MPGEHREKFVLDENAAAGRLYGQGNKFLKRLSAELGVEVGARGNEVSLSASTPEALRLARKIIEELYHLAKRNYPLSMADVDRAIAILRQNERASLAPIFLDTIYTSSRGRPVNPKGLAQKDYTDAIRNKDIVFGIGPAGTGKCIAGSSLVLTAQGLVPIESLARGTREQEHRPLGMEISGLFGVERASHVYNGGTSATRRIKTRLGFEIEATPEHPLLRLTPRGEVLWQRAEALCSGDYIAIQRGQNLFGQSTRIDFAYKAPSRHSHSKAIQVDQLDEELAYFLGILTGDGCLSFKNRVILSSADEEIVACFHGVARRLGLHVFRNGKNRKYDYIIASTQLYQLLLHLGMSSKKAPKKRIPAAILCAPRPLVAAFLRGLFDTDGTVEKRGGYPSLASVSTRLINEVQVLLLNFGILASKRTRSVSYRGQKRICHELEIRGAEAETFYEEIGFSLPRKQALRQYKNHNTNVDIVPHISGLIQAAMRATTLSHAVHRQLHDYRIGRRQPSYPKLREILKVLESCRRMSEAYARLEALSERNLFWAEITEIEEGEGEVYDLTVPGSHSFCANGFVNHNTYLAMAMAVASLARKEVKRIVLCRPAVEAGEKLGFLPGDLAEKVNPYLRPLYDALHDMMDIERAQQLLLEGTIEVAPLAFMRGRTLNDSFVILDEAQNTSAEQMKMFLTRLGFDSKAVITGDITQIDLPSAQRSGLLEAKEILQGIPGIAFCYFSEQDVVRHPLVQEVLRAYDRAEARRQEQASKP